MFIVANPSANLSAFIVSWCRYKYDNRRMGVLATEINTNPSDTFHDYTVDFKLKSEDSTSVSHFVKGSAQVFKNWIPFQCYISSLDFSMIKTIFTVIYMYLSFLCVFCSLT